MNTQSSRLLPSLLAITLLAGAAGAQADGGGDAILGAVIGAATGALVGHQLGGRDGAVIGSALGGATGAALASDNDRRSRYYAAPAPVMVATPAYAPAPYPVAVYAPPAVVYGAPVVARPYYDGGGWHHRDHDDFRHEGWGEEYRRHEGGRDGRERFDRR